MTTHNADGSQPTGQPKDPSAPLRVVDKKIARWLIIGFLLFLTFATDVFHYTDPVYVYWCAVVIAWLVTFAKSDYLSRIVSRAAGTTVLATIPVLLFLYDFNSTPANERIDSTVISSWEQSKGSE